MKSMTKRAIIGLVTLRFLRKRHHSGRY